MIAARTGECQW